MYIKMGGELLVGVLYIPLNKGWIRKRIMLEEVKIKHQVITTSKKPQVTDSKTQPE